MSAFSVSTSMILPLPSSPHWAPTRIVFAINCSLNRYIVKSSSGSTVQPFTIFSPTSATRPDAAAPKAFGLAEREGFEPSIPFWSMHAFQACAFNHSAISPPERNFRRERSLRTIFFQQIADKLYAQNPALARVGDQFLVTRQPAGQIAFYRLPRLPSAPPVRLRKPECRSAGSENQSGCGRPLSAGRWGRLPRLRATRGRCTRPPCRH